MRKIPVDVNEQFVSDSLVAEVVAGHLGFDDDLLVFNKKSILEDPPYAELYLADETSAPALPPS